MKKLMILILILPVFVLAQNKLDYYFYSQAAFEKNDFYSALKYIDSALSENQNPYFLYYKGLILRKLNKKLKAIDNLKTAYKKGYKPALLQIAKIYAKSNVDSALFYLDKYLKFNDKVKRSKIILDTDFYVLQKNKKWKSFWKKNYYSALELKYAEIEFLIDNQDFTKAIVEVNNLLKENKKRDKAYFLKGLILYKNENYTGARKNFIKALKIKQKQQYLFYTAKSFFKEKKYDKSLFYALEYLKQNPYDLKFYVFLAKIYDKNKDYENALKKIDYYLKFYPSDDSVLFQKAEILYHSGDYLSAIKILNSIFDTYPDKSEIYSLRGMAYLNSNSYSEAFHDFSQALDLNPKLTGLYYYRGISSYKRRNTDMACADWYKAIENKDFKANQFYYKYCKNFDQKIKKQQQ